MHAIDVPLEGMFQALADPTRIRIVRVLAAGSEEACLCELVDSLLEPQYKLSRHLKAIRQAGLLDVERDGRFLYHRLVVRHAHLVALHHAIRALPDHRGVFAADLRRFRARIRLRESGRCRIGIRTASLAAASREPRSKRAA